MSQEGEREKNETIISTLSELSPRRDNFRVILQHRSQTYTGLATITYTKRQPKLLIRSWRTRIVSYCFTITKKKKKSGIEANTARDRERTRRISSG